jgi:hypothetical protein
MPDLRSQSPKEQQLETSIPAAISRDGSHQRPVAIQVPPKFRVFVNRDRPRLF